MDEQKPEEKKNKITTKVTCPHCGKDFETQVEVPEVPEAGEAPKMTWQP